MLSFLLYTLIPLAVIALDQFVKYLAVIHLKPSGDVPLIQDVLHLEYVENRGAAFGSLQGQMVFFYLATMLMLALMVWALYRNWVRGKAGRAVVLCLIGGTLGNFIDRVRLGYVVDMISFTLIDFPVFNVADIFLTCGCAALFVYFVFFDDKLQAAAKKEEKAKENKEDADGNDPS